MPRSGFVFQVFIENPAGTNVKHTFNEKTLEPIKTEIVAANYPFPYGFILNTTSGDGDNVDCFVITGRELKTGDIVDCKAAGLIVQIEDGEVDNKILGTICGEEIPVWEEHITMVREFAQQVFAHLPDKIIEVGDFMEKEVAEQYINGCLD